MRPSPSFLSSDHYADALMAAVSAGAAPGVHGSHPLCLASAYREDALRLAAYRADRAWVGMLLPVCGTFMPALDGLAVRCAENPLAPLPAAQETLLELLLFPVDHPQWMQASALRALGGKHLRFLDVLRRAADEGALGLSAAVLARAHVGHWLELGKAISVLASKGQCAVLDQVLTVHAPSRALHDALWAASGNHGLGEDELAATVALLVSRLAPDKEFATLLAAPPVDLLPSEVARRTARLLSVLPACVLARMPPARWSGSAPARARMMAADLPPSSPTQRAIVRL